MRLRQKKDKLEENDIRIPLDENSNDVTAFLAKQAVKATSKLKIRAIITDSYSGRTARNLAAFRGKYPVLAICYKEKDNASFGFVLWCGSYLYAGIG